MEKTFFLSRPPRLSRPAALRFPAMRLSLKAKSRSFFARSRATCRFLPCASPLKAKNRKFFARRQEAAVEAT
jgi:hypothetical protein